MIVLGIESSCDETAAAVVSDGRWLRSSVVASQVPIHRRYGGVVPEVASRQHVLAITPTVGQALAEAGLGWEQIDLLAATYGPGLAGSLLVGLNLAKALAFARGLPFVDVNHLEAHIYANWLVPQGSEPAPAEPDFPLLCLVVSGGHSDLILMRGHGDYRRLGRTRDDAAGEAFDKVARLLGLGYPGGPAVQEAAEGGNPRAFSFPRAWLRHNLDFSFSGLKTAVLRTVEELAGASGARGTRQRREQSHTTPAQVLRVAPQANLPTADLAASFQQAVVDVLVEKSLWAAERYHARQIALAGGVAANALLRREMAARSPLPVLIPPLAFCTDNAAVVASCGYFRRQRGAAASLDLDVRPSLEIA
ncbi:MAG: tRNA (adenosine(37)-N6)-threonylcarbamoyltransferase complex transferase subunit TsaD [Chloroflexi bacterium]|nr:tRNA (adenosine(37)-N6)-threonylcarbamoyltransferase complex transferase subunit TsaD [Chloroflexota bacterium]MCL5108128.1 tRNA (adenosine(37)-N6)-threonylcarbamoyltransferase complex transferase subunit TsaD [Chloroflexota bacterium]